MKDLNFSGKGRNSRTILILLGALSNLLVEIVFFILCEMFVQLHSSEESLRALHDDTARPHPARQPTNKYGEKCKLYFS